MAPFVVFRFDASPSIGSGHAFRCLALAQRMVSSGWRVLIVASDDTFGAVRIPGEMERILVEGDREDEAATLGTRVGPTDLLIVDHYAYDADFESACRDWARCILVIDDLADRRHDCDFLLDQTLGRQDADYRPLVPRDCRLLLGPNYALLREDFPALRAEGLRRRNVGGLERILVSMGGADPNDVTAKVVTGILDSGVSAAVDVVLGATEASPALVSAVERGGGRARLFSRVENMAELMAAADLAFGAGGVTSWERCCMGLPAFIIVTADNQNLIAARLAAAGAAKVLGWHTEVRPERVTEALREVTGHQNELRQMSAAAWKICDGRGGKRVIEAVGGMN